MTDQELKDLVASLAIGQAKTDEQLAKTDAQLAKTHAEVKKMAKTIGSFGRNLGEITEEFFYNSLKKKRILAGIKYDFTDRHWKNRIGQVEDEYDVIMVNGTDIAIIEVKYAAHVDHVTTLLTKKHPNFKILFPMYQDYHHHLGIATFSLSDEVKKMALDNGVMVLQRVGKIMETFTPII